MTSISIEPGATAADIDAVSGSLLAFNVAMIGDPKEEPVQVFLRDDDGQIVGGLLGHIRWRWLYVAKLWIAESHRGQGQGAALLAAAEQYAISRECIGSYLDTFEYQARPFYERCGYQLCGTLEGYPPGYRQFFLSKRLDGEWSPRNVTPALALSAARCERYCRRRADSPRTRRPRAASRAGGRC